MNYSIVVFFCIIAKVLGVVDRPATMNFYITNILISDLKRFNLQTCQTIDDCPIYASDCLTLPNTSFNYCHYQFYCRTDYACYLGIPVNNNVTLNRIQRQQPTDAPASSYYHSSFQLGEESKLKMLTTKGDDCFNACSTSADCYSGKCEKSCCKVNSEVEEFICGPIVTDYQNTEFAKQMNETAIKSQKVLCKHSNYQSCTSNTDCYSNVCDYSGICLDNIDAKQQSEFNKEATIFYVFIGIIVVLISSVILCSMYFGRKVNKGVKGKRKHLLED